MTPRGRTDAIEEFKLDDFELGKELGEGGFGVVYTAICKKDGPLRNKEIALKKVIVTPGNDRAMKLLQLEVANHKIAQHENIVTFHGYFHENENHYIVMELCPHGSLRDYGVLKSEEAVYVLRQLINALEHLHSKGICHRDLTAANVLIDRIRQDGGVRKLTVKICDFGLAKVMASRVGLHTIAGTPNYMDPQAATGRVHGKEVDLFSLGGVLYKMLTGEGPRDYKDLNRKFPKLGKLTADAVELIKHLTEKDVNKRIKLEEIKKSTFMTVNDRAGMEIRNSGKSREKSRERRLSIDRRSISRGREVLAGNRSPPVRQPSRPRNNSLIRKNQFPSDFARLEGKHHVSNGWNLTIVSTTEAVLTEQGIEKCRIRSDRNPPRADDPYYDKFLALLEEIRWKVAKVIYHNSSVCVGGTIKLMENGDLRVIDKQGNKYSVRANSETVYEGDPKHPTRKVSDAKKIREVLKYRDLCLQTETMIAGLDLAFPFISSFLSEPKDKAITPKSAPREASIDPILAPVSSGVEERVRAPSREPRRATSSCTIARKPLAETALTHRSAPTRSMTRSEHVQEKFSLIKTTDRKVIGIKDKKECQLRISTSTKNVFVYTDTNGVEYRCTYLNDNIEWHESTPRDVKEYIKHLLNKLIVKQKEDKENMK